MLLAAGVLINYLDRVNLSVAIAQIEPQFGLSTVMTGYLLSSFSWTYAVLQLPVGSVLDRFGVKRVMTWATLLWSVSCFATASAPGMPMLFASRLLLGVAEAPTFPANAKSVAEWFPRERRGLATSIFDCTTKLSSAIGIPLVALVTVWRGWRFSFIVTGVISFAYFVLFALLYKPAPQPTLANVTHTTLATLGVRKQVLGLAIGLAAINYSFYLQLTWLPSYLRYSMHLNVLQAGLYTAIPWVGATLSGFLLGGLLGDRIIARGLNASRVRLWVLTAGLGLGTAVVCAPMSRTPAMASFWITLALCGVAAAGPVAWSLPGLIVPASSTGKVAGIMNFGGNLSGIAAPIITGYLVAHFHSFFYAFLFAAGMLLVGIAAYWLLVGDSEHLSGAANV